MSDQVYGAQVGGDTGGGTSSTSAQDPSTQQAGQANGQEGQQSNEPAITPEYLKEMEARIIDEATRRAQSMTDKLGSRLDKEIQTALDQATNSIELAKAAGLEMTPQQEQAIKDRAINNAYSRMNQQSQQSSSPGSDPQQPAPQPDQGNNLAMGNFINAEVQKIMRRYDVFIPPDEANQLIGNVGGPYEYLQAFESIASTRQQNRLGGQPPQPGSTIPSMVPQGRAPGSTALRDQYENELAQIRKGKHPSIKLGDEWALTQLERSYRDKGLDI